MAEKWIEDYIGRGIFEGAPDTPEEVDAYLREQGYDPDSLVSRMKIRISEALDNAKARMEREAAMQRANERRAAEVAVIEAAANASRAYREWEEVSGQRGFNFRLAMIDLHDTLVALAALDAPAWMDETREVEVE